jgi:hypothetical protein
MTSFVYGKDKKYLLKDLRTPILSANLLGEQDITLTTGAQLINISGDNSNYNGTITIPDNIQAVIYKNSKSRVNLSRNDVPTFTYDSRVLSVQGDEQDDEQDDEYDEQHIHENTELRTGKQIQKRNTLQNNLKSNMQSTKQVKSTNKIKTASESIAELISKNQKRLNKLVNSKLQIQQQNNDNEPINTGKAALKKKTKTVLKAQNEKERNEKEQNEIVTFDELPNDQNNNAFSSISNMFEKLKANKRSNSILKNALRSISKNNNNIKQKTVQNEEENIGNESSSEEESVRVQIGKEHIVA